MTDRTLTPLQVTLTALWMAIRDRHGDLPRAVLVVGAEGTDPRKPGWLKLGHWSAGRWSVEGDEAPHGEVCITGEGLKAGALELLDTVLHEAAHALASARGIKDHSRGGQYHNKRYKAIAEELGLEVAQSKRNGWNLTSVPEATVAVYQDWLDKLEPELDLFRRSAWAMAAKPDAENGPQEAEEGAEEAEEEPKPSGRLLAVCGCETPRKLRVSRSVFDLGPIGCGLCGSDFAEVTA